LSNNETFGLSEVQLDIVDDIEEKLEIELARKFF
jgi:hypothetical protein